MPIIIDGDSLLKNVKRLPTEAFFVDTNIILAYRDPISASYKNAALENLNVKTTELIHKLISANIKSYTTFAVAAEYYKHIQVNSYAVYKRSISQKKFVSFDSDDFKDLKENDLTFLVMWERYVNEFKKPFKKTIEILDNPLNPVNILASFEGTKIDFGDHLLYEIVKTYTKYKCIFTNDSDFYSIDDDDLYIITFNKSIINRARKERKLHNISSTIK